MDDAPFVDEELEPNPDLNRITNAVIGAAIAVHRELGPGYFESVYENALAIEFHNRGIEFQRQVMFPVLYDGQLVGEGKLDFLIEKQLIVELKAVDSLSSIHTAQVIAYLKATNCRLALLINFNVRKLVDGVKRVAK